MQGVPRQLPLEQFVQSGQVCPQEPQLRLSFLMLISQPSVRLSPLQSTNPAEQEPLQSPPEHAGRTLLLLHTIPHPPQFLGSAAISFSQPSESLSKLQSAHPGTHAPVHPKPEHVRLTMCASLQLTAHPPQLLGFVRMLVSQPSVRRSPLQLSNPWVHNPPQLPPLHVRTARFAELQVAVQPPQLLGSSA